METDDSSNEIVVVNRALLPLHLLRDYVPVPTNSAQRSEQRLAAAMKKLDKDAGVPPPLDKVAARLAAITDPAAGGGGMRKQSRVSFFEKCYMSEPFGSEQQLAPYFLQFLNSKEMVNTMITSVHLMRFTTSLSFQKMISVQEIVRLGFMAMSNVKDTRAGTGKSPSRVSGGNRKLCMGLLQGCHLSIGDSGSHMVGLEGVEGLNVFFNIATRESCIIDKFAIQMDSSVHDEAIQGFVKCLNKPVSFRLQNLSLEGCTIGSAGMQVLCDVMRKGSLPVLTSLNASRNNAQYMGIHRLSATIATGCCPLLSSLQISSNNAKSAVFEFFDTNFATKTTFLTKLEAQQNNCDLLDPDILAILNKGMTTWRNLSQLDLSFNPLGDSALHKKLLSQVWPLTTAVYAENFHAKIIMEKLVLQGCEMGVNSLSYLSQVMMEKDCTILTSLSIGMNNIDLTAIKTLIDPMIAGKLPALKELSLPLNLIQPEGIVLFNNACTLGALDNLELLDIADVGGNSESILILARTLVLRWKNKQLSLRRLAILGRAPFAGRNARVMFGKEFMEAVQVS